MSRTGFAARACGAGLAAAAVFGLLAVVIASGGGAPAGLDQGVLAWSVGHRPGAAVALTRALTATGTGVVPYALVASAGIVAGRSARQRLTAAVLAVVCLAVGQALRQGVMELVARHRPPPADWQTHASGWAFPSGHTTTAAVTAGLLITAICLRAPRARGVLCVAVGCWAAAVGLTRAYLGVHWATDVIGGWLFALGWLGLCLSAVSRWVPHGFGSGTTHTVGRTG
ncbi:phosphatase PAP2 family protein [Streptomyces sp. NPDC002004]